MVDLSVGIDAREAKRGAREFDRSAKTVTDASDRMRDANGRLIKGQKRATRSSKNLTAQLRRLVTVAAGFAILRDATRVVIEYDRAIAELGAVSGATERELAQLSATARELGATTSFSAKEAAEGLLFLSRAGFTATESISALPPVLNLAVAGTLDLGKAADLTSNILGQFNLEVAETERVVDTLVATANRANTDITQLAEALEKVGPVANALGVEIEDASALIGKLGDQGIQGAEAGTQLRAVLASIAAPAGEGAKALADLGLTAEQLDIQANGVTNVLRTLRDANIDAEAAFKIFGREAAAAGLILLGSADAADELAAQVRAADGEAEKIAGTLGDTLQGKVKSLRSSIEELYLQAGDQGLAGALGTLLDFTIGLTRGLAGLDSQMGSTSTAFIFAQKVANGLIRVWKGFIAAFNFLGLAASAFAAILLKVVVPAILNFVNHGAVFIVRLYEVWRTTWDLIAAYAESVIDQIVIGFQRFGAQILLEIANIVNEASRLAFRVKGMKELAEALADVATNARITGSNLNQAANIAEKDAGKAVEAAADQFNDAVINLTADVDPDATVFGKLAKAAESKGDELVETAKRIRRETKRSFQDLTDFVNDGPPAPTRPAALVDLSLPAGATGPLQNTGGGPLPLVAPAESLGVAPRGGAEAVDRETEERLQALRDGFLSERDLLQREFEENQKFLADTALQEGELQAERDKLAQDLAQAHQDKLKEIEKAGQDERRIQMARSFQTGFKMAQQSLAAVQQLLVASGNQQLAESKAFGVAQAVISTAIGISRALELGFPAAIPAMALAAATGAAQIAAINKASKGSGSPPSAPGGLPGGGSSPSGGTTPTVSNGDGEDSDDPGATLVLRKGYINTDVIADAVNDGIRTGKIRRVVTR